MASFAKASDFATVVSIPVVGTLGFLTKHYLQYSGNVAKPLAYSPTFDAFWAMETSLWSHVFCFSITFIGVASAIYLIHRVDKFISSER